MVDVNRPNPWLAGFLCVGLAAFYLLVLYWLLFPRVSEGYRAYYIERSTSLTPFEQMKAARNLGEPVRTIRFDDEGVHFSGWYEAEAGFRWSRGHEATVEFFLAQAKPLRNALVVSAQYLDDQRVIVELNGEKVASYGSRTAPRDLLIDLPQGLVRPGDTNILRFRLPDARKPDNGDQRILALALLAIEVY